MNKKMSNKNIIIFILVFIYLISLVTAIDFKTDLKLHFNFSQTTGNILNSANQSAYSATDYKISNRASTGKVGSGYRFSSSANDYIQMADHTIFDRNANDDMTMNVWVNMSNYAESSYLPSKCDFQTAWNREFCIFVFAASHGTNPRKLSSSIISTKDSSGAIVGQYLSADNFPVKEWVMVSFVANSTRLKTYVNAVLVGDVSYSGGIADDTGVFTIGVMEKTATTTNFNGTMDEVSLWSRTLSQNEINLLYNNGNGCDIIANPEGCVANININSNLANTNNINTPNISINFNLSHIGLITEKVNCSLIINNIINQTLYDLDIPEIPTISSNYEFLLSFGNVEETLNIKLYCENVHEEVTKNTLEYIYNIDRILPELKIETNLVNNSLFLQNTTLYTYINITDVNLYAYNISLFYGNNNIENYFLDNINVGFIENKTSRILSLAGNYTFKIQAWDSHTANLINEYDIKLIDNKYIINNDLVIYGDDIKYYKDNKLMTYFIYSYDRYKLKVTYEDTNKFKTFYLESEKDLIYISDSKYKGHFIYNLEKWIDFEGKNIKYVDVEKISKNKYKVIVELIIASDEVEYESIGDLNYNELVYNFEVYLSTYIPSMSPLINLTGLENVFNNMNNTFLSFGVLFLFVFNILFFIFLQITKKINNMPILIILNLTIFIILQMKMMVIGEIFYSWICFFGWSLGLIDYIYND
jgi:hypothetical protein